MYPYQDQVYELKRKLTDSETTIQVLKQELQVTTPPATLIPSSKAPSPAPVLVSARCPLKTRLGGHYPRDPGQ